MPVYPFFTVGNLVKNGVYDVNTLSWVPMQQPVINGDLTVAVSGLATTAKQDTGNTSLASVDTKLSSPSTFVNGTKAFATAGTREALVASSTPMKGVLITAKDANTGVVYIGGSNVTTSNAKGLAAGKSMFVAGANLASIYGVTTVDTEGVVFLLVN